MVGFGGLILEGSHCFGRAVWNRGESNRGFQGRRSRFEVWVIHLVWTIIFNTRGGVMGFQGIPENTRRGVEWGTNVKGGGHAPTSKGKPLRRWEVQTWYSTILLDCRYPQSRPMK